MENRREGKPMCLGEPFELFDPPEWTKERKLIPQTSHGIGGLGNIARSNLLSASPATGFHYHHDIMEIFAVIRGRRRCILYADGETVDYEYKGNEAFIVYPDQPHISGTNSIDPCDMFAIQFKLSEGANFLGLNTQNGEKLCAALRGIKNHRIEMNPAAFALLKSAFDAIATATEEGCREGASYLACFAYTLLRLPPVSDSQAPDERIRNVLDYIAANIHQPLTLTELADHAGYSLSRFKALFRLVTGETPAQYITMQKVEQAKRRLCMPESNITEIAYDLGWSSSNYFCAVFKKYTGMSPLHYRKQNLT